jgi:hypothetical protein
MYPTDSLIISTRIGHHIQWEGMSAVRLREKGIGILGDEL